MSQKLLFIFNPHAGKGQIKNHLVDIVDMMVKAGFDVTIYTTCLLYTSIENATKIARAMVTMYGMSDTFGMMCLATVENQYLDGRAGLICGEMCIRDRVTSGAVQLCIRPRNGKRDIPCNYSGQNEPCRLHPY